MARHTSCSQQLCDVLMTPVFPPLENNSSFFLLPHRSRALHSTGEAAPGARFRSPHQKMNPQSSRGFMSFRGPLSSSLSPFRIGLVAEISAAKGLSFQRLSFLSPGGALSASVLPLCRPAVLSLSPARHTCPSWIKWGRGRKFDLSWDDSWRPTWTRGSVSDRGTTRSKMLQKEQGMDRVVSLWI